MTDDSDGRWLAFPFATLAGDCPAHRAMSVLSASLGRRTHRFADLCERADCETPEDYAEVADQLRKLAILGAIREPSPGIYHIDYGSKVGRSLARVDWACVAEGTDEYTIADVEVDSW